MTNSQNAKSIQFHMERFGLKTYYVYNGKRYSSKDEMMKQIQRDNPNLTFKNSGSSGKWKFPKLFPNRKNSFKGPNNPSQNSIKRPSISNNKYPQLDINKYLGKNQFSNKIWHHVWDGCDTNCFSNKHFYQMRIRMLKESNMYRAYHNAPPLVEDQYLTKVAQYYAEKLVKISKLMHDPNNKDQGENLGVASLGIAHMIVKRWYDEVDLYKFHSNQWIPGAGHFTQLVWKSSQKVGFGIATLGNQAYVVCRYYPRGNVSPYYIQNVSPRR